MVTVCMLLMYGRFIGVCVNEGQVHALVEVSHFTAIAAIYHQTRLCSGISHC